MRDDQAGERERLKSFWNSRYQEFSLRESGIKTLTPKFSELLYKCKRAAYTKALRVGGIDRQKPVRILDGGCGQGFFASVAREVFRSPSYTGVDISEKAVTYLRQQYPIFEWLCADLANFRVDRELGFDLAQSIEVLHLILDDRHQKDAIKNLSDHLRPGGTLVITDTLPASRHSPNEYIAFRTLDHYANVFRQADLELLSIFPMYYWVPDMGFRSGPMARFTRRIPRSVYLLDRLFLSLNLPKITQSHDSEMKMMVCRKRARS
jgi:SAM-dependent methyltransferase